MTAHVSWLLLERFVLGELEGDDRHEVEAHVEHCLTCRQALHTIETDVRPMPALALPSRGRRWWALALPLLAAAGALWVVLPRPDVAPPPHRAIKGGELAIAVVRERDGAVREDPRVYQPGDRIRVHLTCPPGDRAYRLVAIEGSEPPAPLAGGTLACRNRAPVPGAFTLTGPHDVTICATLDEAPELPVCLTLIALNERL